MDKQRAFGDVSFMAIFAQGCIQSVDENRLYVALHFYFYHSTGGNTTWKKGRCCQQRLLLWNVIGRTKPKWDIHPSCCFMHFLVLGALYISYSRWVQGIFSFYSGMLWHPPLKFTHLRRNVVGTPWYTALCQYFFIEIKNWPKQLLPWNSPNFQKPMFSEPQYLLHCLKGNNSWGFQYTIQTNR